MTTLAPSSTPLADLSGLLAELLSFPGPALEAGVRQGDVRQAVEHLAGHLSFGLDVPLAALGPMAIAGKELESEYIRLFDVPDAIPTPLYTGVYSPRRRDAMEELLRFYRFFGLTVAGESHDLPDFVPTVLEFLGFLAARRMSSAGDEGQSLDAAIGDLLERHLHPWATHTLTRLESRDAHQFYRGVVAVVAQLTGAELYRLRVAPGAAQVPSR